MEEQVFESLKKCPLFSDMTREAVESSLSAVPCRLVNYDKGEMYALAGVPCRHADIVVAGTLVCRMMALSGKQVEVSRLKEGNMVAPAFLFAHDGAMPVSVEAATSVRVLRMSKDSFRSLIDGNAQLRMNFIRALSDIDVFLTKKMRFLSLMTVREKVAFLIRERAREQKSMSVTLYRSRQEIADSFGVQKYSLLRALAELEKEGVVKVDNRHITILRWDALK